MPPFHVETTFLEQPCGSGYTHGVNPEMHERLAHAEKTIKAAYDELPPHAKDESLAAWAGVYGPHPAWKPFAAQHSAGAAIDINPIANTYIVTRNGTVPGGEPGGEMLVEMRNRALAAYDRATQFIGESRAAADVSPRRANESTASVWRRFKAASDSLAAYLSFAIDPRLGVIERVAVENADALSDEELLATIGEQERLALEPAIEELEAYMRSDGFRETHPGWPLDARAQYLRMLRDYEAARIPMVIGSPSATPEKTRNPARGLFYLPCEIVTALCEQDLRWGACDFEIHADGSSHNGAMMHFDLADCGGYPEINSLLRFG